MKPNTLANIVQVYTGQQTRVRGQEVVVERCMWCGNDRWNLEVNPIKRVYNCWACTNEDARGDLEKFLEKIGYDRSVKLPEDPLTLPDTEPKSSKQTEVSFEEFPSAVEHKEAVDYLNSRGVDLEDIKRYDLRYCPRRLGEWGRYILFPLYDYFNQERITFQGRHIDGRDPKYRLYQKTERFIGWRNYDTNIHIVTEGVFDALKVHKAGFNSCMLLGLGNLDSLKPWASTVSLNPNHEIYVFLDGSAKKEAWKLRQTISQITDRCEAIMIKDSYDPGDLSPKQINKIVRKLRNAAK